MAFNFGKLLNVVKAVSKTPVFQAAAEMALNRVGDRLLANADHPEEIKAIAKELIAGAPEMVGAIVKGTEAEGLVDPALIHQPEPKPAG